MGIRVRTIDALHQPEVRESCCGQRDVRGLGDPIMMLEGLGYPNEVLFDPATAPGSTPPPIDPRLFVADAMYYTQIALDPFPPPPESGTVLAPTGPSAQTGSSAPTGPVRVPPPPPLPPTAAEAEADSRKIKVAIGAGAAMIAVALVMRGR